MKDFVEFKEKNEKRVIGVLTPKLVTNKIQGSRAGKP